MPENACTRLSPGLLLLALLVFAAGLPRVAAGETPAQYDVEIIVFRNLAGQADGEQWPEADAPMPDAYRPPARDAAAADLAASPRRLQRIADALDRSGAYRVLEHRAWRQTAHDRSLAIALPVIAAGGQLDGTVTLVRERFLHLDVDLVLESIYTLDETRRVRSGERHYFDHPMFGVIAEVTPYSAPAPAAPQETVSTDSGVTPAGEVSDTPAADSEVPAPVPLPQHRVRQAPY
jgi:hypothetical protein